MNNLIKLVVLGGMLLVFNATATQLKLSEGVYEGITAQDAQFHLLEVTTGNAHRYIVTPITTGFKTATIYPFSDKDIACDTLSCLINLQRVENSSERLRLIVTLNATAGLDVLSITTDAAEKPLLTGQFHMHTTDGTSTVRTFLQQYLPQLKALNGNTGQHLAGLWLGVLTMNNQHDLLLMDVVPEGISSFRRFISASKLSNETQFTNKDIQQKDGSYFINTTHLSFANKLIIHPLSSTTLQGYFYSSHQQQVLQTGMFTLTRLGAAAEHANPQN